MGFFNISVTKGSSDYGVDIIATKNGVKYAIQCKRYSSNVGISTIQEVSSGMQYYKCNKGMVITNNYFTPNAINLANTTNVELFDRDKLRKYI